MSKVSINQIRMFLGCIYSAGIESPEISLDEKEKTWIFTFDCGSVVKYKMSVNEWYIIKGDEITRLSYFGKGRFAECIEILKNG